MQRMHGMHCEGMQRDERCRRHPRARVEDAHRDTRSVVTPKIPPTRAAALYGPDACAADCRRAASVRLEPESTMRQASASRHARCAALKGLELCRANRAAPCAAAARSQRRCAHRQCGRKPAPPSGPRADSPTRRDGRFAPASGGISTYASTPCHPSRCTRSTLHRRTAATVAGRPACPLYPRAVGAFRPSTADR